MKGLADLPLRCFAMPLLASPTKPPAAGSPRAQARLIAAASLGNALEMFDFTVFSFFSGIIGELYFPSATPYGSLLMAVAVFGVGFVMRPLGSLVLGAYADRAGRKAALLLTISLMGLGTLLIALAPTQAQIGLWAPLILLAGRLLQGFSAGGEIGAATALLVESAAHHSRGFYVSWQVASQGLASLAGSLCGALLAGCLSHEALYSWGWRLPFLLGLTIIPVGLYIRRRIDETHRVGSDGGRTQARTHPALVLLRQHLAQFVSGIGIIMAATLLMYIIVLYMPTYMIRVGGLSAARAFMVSILVSLVLIGSSIFGGWLLDRSRAHKPVAIASLLLALLLVYPSFVLLGSPDTLYLGLLCRLLLVAGMGINLSAGLLLIIEAYPRPVRATGLAMTYALGVTLFGGTAQFIVTWLVQLTGNPLAPAWYLIIMLSISLLAFIAFPERHHH